MLTSNDWTNASGTSNGTFSDGAFAVFQATPGTVTVSTGNGAVNVAGMQFASDGYVVQGDPINLVGGADDPTHSTIRVGDGTRAGAAYTATIGTPLTGDSTLVKSGAGTLVLTGANTYTGGTTINSGTLQIGNGGNTGSIIGDVTDNGSLVFDTSNNLYFDGAVTGSGSLVQAGKLTLVLAGENTYTGGTILEKGTLIVGNGSDGGSISGDIVDNGSLVFHRTGLVVYAGSISGGGKVTDDVLDTVDGTLILDGDSSRFTGTTYVRGASLIVGSTPGSGAALGGQLTILDNLGGYGSVGTTTINGHLQPGSSTQIGRSGPFGTLTVNGDLDAQGDIFDINLGAPGATQNVFGIGDNIRVNGNVTLEGGELSVHDTGNMGPGLYNVISYTGTLSGSPVFGYLGLGFVSPKWQFTLQYVPGQVNLLVEPNPEAAIWAPNGPSHFGGGGTWTPTSTTWTDNDGSAPLGPMPQSAFVEFKGLPGNVVVNDDGAGIVTMGMDFSVDGYIVSGNTTDDQVVLVRGTRDAPVIEVGDESAGSASDKATICAVLAGDFGFIKTGYGTLVLTGLNTLAGTLQINGGTMELAGGGVPNVSVLDINNQAGMDSKLQVDAGIVIDTPVSVSFGAVLNNFGSITNVQSVQSDNFGTIKNMDGGSISNSIGDGVVLFGGGIVINSGSESRIYGGGRGVWFSIVPGNVMNADGASISGAYGGLRMAGGEVINTGKGSAIFASDPGYPGAGIMLAGGVVENSGGASISGFGPGVFIYNGGELNNDGTGSSIYGGGLSGGGDLGGYGVEMSGAGSTVKNTGGASISGDLTGISLKDGGTVTNGRGSLIESLSAGLGDCSNGVHCGIYVETRYVNHGGPLTLINAGSIIGDVQMDPNAINLVKLTTGGRIDGNLEIGTNPASTLTLNGDSGTSQLYSDAVSGTTTFAGVLIKDGAGTWTIDESGQLLATDTTIKSGTLKATGVLSGNVEVNAGGAVDGAPGVSGGLVSAGVVAVHDNDSTVGGTYIQSATGTLAVSLGSKLDVTGSATLNGGTLEVTGANSGYVSNTHTDVLTAAGGVSGTFSQLVKDSGVVFTSTTINYGANSVWLDTTGLNVTTAAAGNGVSYTPASMGSAQRVQGAFDQLDASIAAGNRSGVSSTFLQAAGQFQQSPNLLAAQASLNSLSGQLHAATAAMTLQGIDASNRALSERFDNLLDPGTKVGMWTQSLDLGGGMSSTGYNGVGFQMNGWLVGSDQRIGHSGVAGFAFGQSSGQQRLDQSVDHTRSRSTDGMLYAGWLKGNWYTQGSVGFGSFQQDVNRRLLLGSNWQGVSTSYRGRYGTAYAESGLHFSNGPGQVSPFVDVAYARINRDAFAEQGAGGFGLRADAQVLDRWQAGLGVRAAHHWEFSEARSLDLTAHAQWQHTLSARGDVFDASFVGLQQWQPLGGIGLSRDSGLFGIGLNAMLSKNTALNFGYDYQIAQHEHAQMVSARLNVTF